MRKVFRFATWVIITLFLLLQGCSIYFPNEILPTPIPTQLVCPTLVIGTQVPLPEDDNSSKLIVVLFQNNSEYAPYVGEIFNSLNFALDKTVHAGDRLVMLDMNANSFDNAVVALANVGFVSAPIAPPTPTQYPTPTPTLPPIATPGAQLAQIAATQGARATAASVSVESTKSAFYYNCASQSWLQQYDVISQQWQKEKDKEVQRFLEDVSQQQSKVNIGDDVFKTSVWEGLSNASLVMENECHKYDRCILIIFSDMNDWRPIRPETLSVDLRDVEVVSALINCKLLYSSECGGWIEKWKEYFFSNEINAKSVDFINGENLEKTLVQILAQ